MSPLPFIDFWKKHPSLLLGFLLLVGTAFSFNHQLVELLVLAALLFPFLKTQKKLLPLLLSVFALGWASASYRTPLVQLPSEKIQTTARLSISSLKNYQSPFHRSLAYRGKLLLPSSEKVPCQIYLPVSANRPRANCDYQVSGTLIQKGPHQFVFKPQKNQPWTPILSTFSLAEARYLAKQAVHTFLKKKIPDSSAATFLNALATGDIDERTLSMEFGKLGIQHILAISGFHFALVTLFLGMLLQLLLSPRNCAIALILLLSTYYLFLGDSPSVQRAWIAVTAFLVGRIFNLRITALNALGAGLCFELLIDPSTIFHLGFVLSFLCTLAILLIYPLMRPLSERLLPSRTFATVKTMTPLDQFGYIIGSFLRQSIAINLAVHLACIPVLLYLFHRVPLLSLVYNLFFPFWVSISLFLLCLSGLFIFAIPPLGDLLFYINTHWTSFALNVTTHPPAFLNFVVRSNSLTYPSTLLLLTILFLAAIYFTENKEPIHLFSRCKHFFKRLSLKKTLKV